VTFSGPPRLLKELLESKSLKGYEFPIDSPYHASHLYGSDDVDEILGQLRDKRLEAYKPRIPILSPSTGSIIVAKDFRALLHRAVTDAMCEQVRWDKILQSCAERVSQHTSFKGCAIWPIASNAAALLSSTLSRNVKLSISSNNSLNGSVEVPQSAMPTGKFEDSKIAIVGFSGRFPEAASTNEFWELLRAGRDVHRTIPEDRFDWKAHFDPTGKKKNTSRVQYGCFINKPGLFDARFFNLSPREAENTDPAQRLAITATYEALEMAGFVPNRTPSTQQDRIGVFFGVTSDDWREVNSGQNIDTYFIPGGNRAFVPGRIRQVPSRSLPRDKLG
jgi:naphtho-gamma-pyrone polyketide synthase